VTEQIVHAPVVSASRPARGTFRDRTAWLLAAVSLVLGAAFVVVDLAYNQGRYIPPLDDVYIHLQYGSQIGDGHFFRFNTGDPISTGASSFLYALVLGAAAALGLSGSLLLAFAVGLGLVCMAATVVLVYRLGCVLTERVVGIWAGLLVAVSGPLLWGAASGMEIGLTAVLFAATLYGFVRERPQLRFVWTPPIAACLALVRPEGLIFAVLVCGVILWHLAGARRRRLTTTGRAVAASALALLPVAAGLGQLLFYRLATGTSSANGLQAKSQLYDRPLFYLGDFVERTVNHLRGFVGFFTALNNQDYTFPGALLVFFIGLAYAFATRPRWRPLLVAIGLGFALVVGSVSTLISALVHQLRYVQPFMPVFFLFAVCGVYALTRVVAQARPRRVLLHTSLVAALLFSVAALPMWALRLGRDSATIRDTDVSVAAWIRANVPAGESVAVKDVGAVAYLGGHRTVDTIGLTTNGLAAPANNGIGSLYEALRHLPPAQRPTYFATYDPPPGPSIQPLLDAGVLRQPPLERFHVRAPTDAYGGRIVPFDQLGVYLADWTLAGTGDRAPVAGQVRDYLNVGHLADEAAHGYRPNMALVGLQPYSVLRREQGVLDSGRNIIGGEEFTVRELVPGRPVTITTRALVDDESQTQLRVLADGVAAGVWNRTPTGEGWATYSFTVPGELVRDSSLRVELRQMQPMYNPYPEYTSFGYWFTQ
jgi:hypothetical protein